MTVHVLWEVMWQRGRWVEKVYTPALITYLVGCWHCDPICSFTSRMFGCDVKEKEKADVVWLHRSTQRCRYVLLWRGSVLLTFHLWISDWQVLKKISYLLLFLCLSRIIWFRCSCSVWLSAGVSVKKKTKKLNKTNCSHPPFKTVLAPALPPPPHPPVPQNLN